MKVRLLYPDRDALLTTEAPPDTADLTHDLGLGDVVEYLAAGDGYVRDVAASTLLRPLLELREIEWRQAVLTDLLRRPAIVQELYEVATRAVGKGVTVRTWRLSEDPTSMVGHFVAVLQALLDPLRSLRRFADDHAGDFRSEGLTALVADVTASLPDSWFDLVEDHLTRLRFPGGIVMTARLGTASVVADLVLCTPSTTRRTWRDVLGARRSDEHTWAVPAEDAVGSQALIDLENRGLASLADVLAQATENILGFFAHLRWEAAFYLGCVTLQQRLRGAGLPCTLPIVRPAVDREMSARGLYDVGLAARSGGPVVGNDLDADGMSLVVVTGANQGGKSTLLRGLGLAQLMMQAGMVVAADEYRASLVPRVHTHFRREEDETLRSGRLDEELRRLSRIVDRASPGDLVLLNESFASTNEREGARIARQIVEGFIDSALRVLSVTHLYEFSHSLASEARPDVLFLRAERLSDGRRSFRIVPGEPLPTSHGDDIWAAVFPKG